MPYVHHELQPISTGSANSSTSSTPAPAESTRTPSPDSLAENGQAVLWDEGTIRTENTPHAGKLSFLYHSYLGGWLKPLMSYTRLPSKLMGAYYDTATSVEKIPGFIKTFNIDMSEYVRENPKDYQSFNDFFSRKIKPEVRPVVSGADEVASPADSRVLVMEGLSDTTEFMVKGKPFNVGKFLNGKRDAAEYQGGTLMVFRLAPQDYHRYHFPVEGVPSPVIPINGYFDSVHPTVYGAGVQPLTENERHLTFIDSREFGEVAMVAVGAMAVGRIVETYTPDEAAVKGDEAGYFQYGGSTVALLFKKDTIVVSPQLLENSAQRLETVVQMGELVGTVKSSD